MSSIADESERIDRLLGALNGWAREVVRIFRGRKLSKAQKRARIIARGRQADREVEAIDPEFVRDSLRRCLTETHA